MVSEDPNFVGFVLQLLFWLSPLMLHSFTFSSLSTPKRQSTDLATDLATFPTARKSNSP